MSIQVMDIQGAQNLCVDVIAINLFRKPFYTMRYPQTFGVPC